jgi:uncharacterized membrane protein YeaQ/YmgE (transglycosylase-associated protein family)
MNRIQPRALNVDIAGVTPTPMEFLRHPSYSILAVVILGATCGMLARTRDATANQVRSHLRSMFVGIGAAFLGFHAAMLSNIATGVIVMPFVFAFAVSLAVSFALRTPAR